ncbi:MULTISPECIES: glycine betaine/L-proline ABC transporter ATP-binding protein ProV [Thiorhodovibrio]|uniref:glycine betaine/L-proline ABC transporter ATP-binding protein ProV n=1 Tax=Thiorhodovibrio TaxID=61593 RepID=UPI0019140AAF|nr:MULTISPECIES: glycine betaine/L-proline ABC transporter ATP-binding protein ProV [Thiorhodovibrio]MBK5967262.1 glycine betaine/L-proline ABC transporter ATP-binding protein [Thiorhodovibrio winogradskyi]WPL14484.1 Glycine betaine/L-proline transport ATP-binding protein ProV [Thiorhodovibrio litoralis]
MTDKLVIEDLYKIFGPAPDEAIALLGQGLGKDEIFKRTGTTVGVQQASFSIREGEVFVVMGLSGSGKSTLVRMINRLIEPTRGRILLDGVDITAMSKQELINMRRHQMSMVFQSFALLPHKTVAENAAFGLDVAGIPASEQREQALKALATVGLEPYADSYPDELSGGMRQRVGLARALATEAPILLMDEAFSALDPLIRTEMQDELVSLQDKKPHTIVFISHDLDEAIRIGDRIAIMEGGRVVQIGTPEEIVTRPANDYVRSFFYGVDVSKVFSAGDIASNRALIVFERTGVNVRAALAQLQDHGRALGVVTDRENRYRGMVSVNTLAAAAKGDGAQWDQAFIPNVEPAPAEMDLSEVLSRVATTEHPIPVVDDQGQYRGIIDKTILLQTLDKTT